jgi:hypothetical protein
VVRNSNSNTHIRQDINLILSHVQRVNKISDIGIMEICKEVWHVELCILTHCAIAAVFQVYCNPSLRKIRESL